MDGKENKRCSVSVSLTPEEKDEFKLAAKKCGLSLSAFLRLSATKYIERKKKTNSGYTSEGVIHL